MERAERTVMDRSEQVNGGSEYPRLSGVLRFISTLDSMSQTLI